MMKKIIISALLLPVLISCTTTQNGLVEDGKVPLEKYMNTITESELRTHLFMIASDEMQGRDTGSEGQKKAGKYLIQQYQKIGLTYRSEEHTSELQSRPHLVC